MWSITRLMRRTYNLLRFQGLHGLCSPKSTAHSIYFILERVSISLYDHGYWTDYIPRGGLSILLKRGHYDTRNAHDVLLIASRGPGTVLKDTLGLAATDVGGGWLIFNPPEADLGVHPTESEGPTSGTADISFYCDDVAQTVSELRARGVEFTQEVEDRGYGLVTFFKVPGGFQVQLYQPK